MKTPKEKVAAIIGKMKQLKPGASFVVAQPTDDMWAEIQRLAEARQERKAALVSPRPTHTKR